LFDKLAARFDADSIFFDAVTLQPGTRWLQDIRAQGAACDAFLAVIGPRWAPAMRERWAGSDEDHVRSEIELALRSASAVRLIVPVLVGDATVPGPREVPPTIKPLLARQRVDLRPADWDADVDALIDMLARMPSDSPRDVDAAVDDAEGEASPSEPRPQIAPRPDGSHFDELVRLMLEDGAVVPFVGPGANSSDRADRWRDVESGRLPDAEELAVYLAQKLGLPEVPADLAYAAQYMSVARGPGDLYRELRRALMQRCPPTSSERFLAQLPATLQELGLEPRYQLIVTTNYDDALERAFEDAEEPYDLAVYMASGEDRDKFVHLPFDGEPRVVTVANTYRDFPTDALGELDRTVIMKIHGAVDGSRGPYEWHDNYVITEDDYIDYLSRGPVASVVPQQLLAKLRESHFLFVGYTMRDWHLRVFLHRLFRQQLPNNSWAIQRSPERVDDRFWRRMGVDLFQIELADYVSLLKQHLAGFAQSTR